MKLYGFPPSPNTWKVRATANQMDIPLELEIVDLTKRAQREPKYLALNPTGRTPTSCAGRAGTCSTGAAAWRRTCSRTWSSRS